MFHHLSKGVTRAANQQSGKNSTTTSQITKRFFSVDKPGDATSPHYADFGYGANQMLPFHEIQKNPIPYNWTPRVAPPKMVPGHHPELHQHQVYSPATGHAYSIVAGFDHVAEAQAKKAIGDRIRAAVSMFSITAGLVAVEVWMWDGVHIPQASIWDEMDDINTRCYAHSLQWEKSWKEMQKEATPSELYKAIRDRPFNLNNPYRFSPKDLEIANQTISNRVLEPLLKDVDNDLYRQQTNYIIFYSELSQRMNAVQDPTQMENELTQWLLTQTKYSVDELKEIMAFAPEWNVEFAFHKNAVYDTKRNQVVFFEGAHRAIVEEHQKEENPVPSIESTQPKSKSFAFAQSLLTQLVKSGPVLYLQQNVGRGKDDEAAAIARSVIGFWATDTVDQNTFDRLLKLSQQVAASADSSLATFQANAKAMGLPVPLSFSVSAINHAIQCANENKADINSV